MSKYLNALKKITILVVEDHKFQRLTLVQMINKLEVKEVLSASDGEEALNIVRNRNIDIVISDLSMPKMDGLALMRHLSNADYKGSIIVSSAMDDGLIRSASNMAKSYDLNLLGAIGKPLNPTKLLKCLITHFSNQQGTTRSQSQFQLTSSEVENAIANEEIVPHFQPQVSFKTGKLVGVEALARFNHPTFGVIGPNAFIHIAEANNLIGELTELMYVKSLKQLDQLPKAFAKLKLSINVSPTSLTDDIIQYLLLNLCAKNNKTTREITIEITEQASFSEYKVALEVLSRLRMNGFNLSLDDFGTGYSTIENMSLFPFTELKIDKSFVDNIDTDPNALFIVESTIELAKKLKLQTVAEGVETESQWRLLSGLGCDVCQGYYVAKPLLVEQLIPAMKNWHQKYLNGVGRPITLANESKKLVQSSQCPTPLS